VLRTRVITALVLAAIVLAAIAWSPFAVAVVLTAALGLAQAEWLQLAGWKPLAAHTVAAVLGVAQLALLAWAPGTLAALTLPVVTLAVVLWVVLAGFLLRVERRGPTPVSSGLSAALALLLPLAAWLAAVQFLRESILMLFSVMAIVWLADIAAYFAGRAFGRAKLAPRISPGKTWAGVWGAMAAVVLVALAVRAGWPQLAVYSNRLAAALGVALVVPLLAALVAFSVAGDLFESWLKRQTGVKDSGALLPGHGGFYDRVDAMMALLPPAALMWMAVR
jgi:phosphatidate cytidylyltransferase